MTFLILLKLLFLDCADLYKQGYKQDGVYTINPDGLGEFQVSSMVHSHSLHHHAITLKNCFHQFFTDLIHQLKSLSGI